MSEEIKKSAKSFLRLGLLEKIATGPKTRLVVDGRDPTDFFYHVYGPTGAAPGCYAL
jgi:hypothetical protein